MDEGGCVRDEFDHIGCELHKDDDQLVEPAPGPRDVRVVQLPSESVLTQTSPVPVEREPSVSVVVKVVV